MQKAEPQQANIQSQPAARQGDRAVSVQGGQIAQLEEMIANSPRQAVQQKFADGIHRSPLAVSQHNRYRDMFGTMQRVGDEETLQGKFTSVSPAQLNVPVHAQIGVKPVLQAKGLPVNVSKGLGFAGYQFTNPAQLMTEEKSIETKNFGAGYYKGGFKSEVQQRYDESVAAS